MSVNNSFWLACVTLMISACTSNSGPHRPLGGRGISGPVNYTSVKPIFAKYCSACHPSRSGPDWLDFSQAVAYVQNGLLLKKAVAERSMPPVGSAEAAAISDQEREEIGEWVRAGGPEAPTANGPQDQSTVNPLVQNCLHCHGSTGPGSESQPKIPRLAGQNKAYIVLQLTGYKWRDRIDPSGAMNDVVTLSMSDDEISAAAEYFSGLPGLAPEGRHAPTGEEYDLCVKGEKIAKQFCISCHQNATNGDRPLNGLEPALDGQSKEYLFNQLLAFRKDGSRSPLMHEFTKNLANDDIAALAEFFSHGMGGL